MKFRTTRKNGLSFWLKETGRKFKITDNTASAFECEWQDPASENGFNHISIFCSIGEFACHITDLLRDYRYDNYEFDKSDEVNEVLFRFYSRLILVISEVITDLQDLWILTNYEISTKAYNRLAIKTKREYQNTAREALSNNTDELNNFFDFANRVCKHKTQNLHICNNHIVYHFEDFKSSTGIKKSIKLGNIKNYIAYDEATFKKNQKPKVLIVPELEYLISLTTNSYITVNNLFADHVNKFIHICEHYEDK